MGRILSPVKICNAFDPEKSIHCDALVDTGSAYMVLPSAWKDRLGKLETTGPVEIQTATQETVAGTIGGPVRIEVEGFRPVYNEVLFVDMVPDQGANEPLIGYIVLEQCQAAVDLLGHCLIRVNHVDLK
jgi:predicted aspartyl protease